MTTATTPTPPILSQTGPRLSPSLHFTPRGKPMWTPVHTTDTGQRKPNFADCFWRLIRESASPSELQLFRRFLLLEVQRGGDTCRCLVFLGPPPGGRLTPTQTPVFSQSARAQVAAGGKVELQQQQLPQLNPSQSQGEDVFSLTACVCVCACVYTRVCTGDAVNTAVWFKHTYSDGFVKTVARSSVMNVHSPLHVWPNVIKWCYRAEKNPDIYPAQTCLDKCAPLNLLE